MATLQPIGPEFPVNSSTGLASEPSVARLDSGDVLIVWESREGPAADPVVSIVGQRFDASGAGIGEEFVVSVSSGDILSPPQVTGLSGGGFVVTWTRYGPFQSSGVPADNNVMAQVFDDAADPIGNAFIVNSTTPGRQENSSITALAGGGFAVSWIDEATSGDGNNPAVKMQVFRADGSRVGIERVANVHSVTAPVFAPEITALANGNLVVAWTSVSSPAFAHDITAQMFTASGGRIGKEFLLNTTQPGDQYLGDVTALPDGRFVVTWSTYDGSGNGSVLSAQLFDGSGAKLGSEFRVDDATGGVHASPVVTPRGDNGHFVIAWEGDAGALGDASGSGITAQEFDASGQRIGDPFLVNTDTAGSQRAPAISAVSADRVFVTWETGDGHDVKAQLFGPADAHGAYTGTADADSFAAPSGADWQIDGLGGSDVLAGNAGDDVIAGGTGRDILSGGGGRDIFVFAPGDSKAGGGVRDIITDFEVGADRLDLSALHITDLAQQVTFRTVGSGMIVYVDTNGNGFDYSDFGVQLSGVRDLAAADFIL